MLIEKHQQCHQDWWNTNKKTDPVQVRYIIKAHAEVHSNSKKGVVYKISYSEQGLFQIIKDCGSNLYNIQRYNDRGYIPKVFAFKNPYPLNPEKSDLFYFLLICTKRPKLPKLQRSVSSSSALRAIKLIPRDTTNLALLLILFFADSRFTPL